MTATVHFRPATPDDFPTILDLNETFVHWLSPLDEARLQWLSEQAVVHEVAVQAQQVVGFLLAFQEGAAYDSPNYRWFASHYPRFYYVDRVVVAPEAHGSRIGQHFYQALTRAALADQVPLLACEIDAEPPNPGSAAFHEKMGFTEVGTQEVYGKRVSLQVKHLTASGLS